MKTTTIAVLILALGGPAGLAQSGNDLFQKALVQERTEGNLAEAIKLYQRILAQHAGNRKLAASALLQMAQCYEKQGNAAARKAYERLLREYSDQPELVSQARAQLAALERPRGAEGASGMRARQVWTGVGVSGDGSVSPDGRYISFPDWSTGDLAVRDLATGTNRRLTNTGGWTGHVFNQDSRFSPDGKLIAYNWFEGKGYELRVMNADGSGVRTLYNRGGSDYVYPHEWSPDGKYIAVTGYEKSEVALVRVADGQAQPLLPRPFPNKMSFSPDGRFLVYDAPVKLDPPQSDLFIIAIDGSRQTPLVQHPAQDSFPVWTPDGSKVLFTSDRTGATGLWAIAVEDGKPKGPAQLVRSDLGSQGAVPLGLTRQGNYVYSVTIGNRDVYVADLDPTAGKVIGQPRRVSERVPGRNFAPRWSPDGQYLAFRSLREAGRPTVTLQSAATGEERDITASQTIKVDGPIPLRWYPDGSALLLEEWAEGSKTHRLYRLDLKTGEISQVPKVENTAFPLSPVFSPDGRKLYYVYRKPAERGRSIRVQDLASNQQTELYRTEDSGLRSMTLSRDGLHLAFYATGIQPRKLLVMPAAGGQARTLLELPTMDGFEAFSGLEFTPDARYIFLVRRVPGAPAADSPSELWRVPVDGGPAEKAGVSMSGISQPTVHPDGKKIAFAAGQNRHEIWALENFLPSLRAAR
ncbi:MAG: tetratricopeptide repeat protein [Acidobacteriota bacterium]